jgi:hypothetical protein
MKQEYEGAKWWKEIGGWGESSVMRKENKPDAKKG